MLHDDPDKPEYFLWRLMIGGQFQRQAPPSASADRFAVTAEWARRFPSEQIWRLHKRD